MHKIREAKPDEFAQLGTLMVDVYARLEGFPTPDKIPDYYDTLRNVGKLTENPKTKLFVAVSDQGILDGGLVYFGDLHNYGAGSENMLHQNAAGFRLLAVNPETRGKGLGKRLIEKCFQQARKEGFEYLLIHSTKYMMIAWKMYERMGFVRYPKIDFEKSGVTVCGFRYEL
jgi:ribosomal protein S18 acetylase RimI-like enzyme